MRIKAYLSIFRMRLKQELQYRGAMIGGICCQAFFGLILVALYRALYAGHPQTVPLEATVSYVWLQQAFFRMLGATDNDLADRIRTGDIAYDLARPLNLYGYYYSRVMAQKLTGSLMRAAPMLVFAALLPKGWGISAPASLPALIAGIAALMLGLVVSSAIENLTVGFTMRTLDPRGIQAMLNLLMMILSGSILPLTLFPDAWQRAIALMPHTQMLDAPIRLYTGQRSLSELPQIIGLQIFWAAALLGLGLLLWSRNRKRLTVQGG